MTDDERNAWLAGRKEAGLKIDPETAEVEWTYGQISAAQMTSTSSSTAACSLRSRRDDQNDRKDLQP